MSERKGELIVVDAIGGAGKDTQLWLLSKYLQDSNQPAMFTREHTRDTPPGILIERIIKKLEDQIDPLALQLLYVCDRRNHWKQVLEPALAQGKLVFCNRYYSTTVAYCPKEHRELILKLNQSVVGRPDLVTIMDIDATVAAGRVARRNDGDIFDVPEILRVCREGYRWYQNNSGDRVSWVDASGTKEEVFDQFLGELRRRKVVK